MMHLLTDPSARHMRAVVKIGPPPDSRAVLVTPHDAAHTSAVLHLFGFLGYNIMACADGYVLMTEEELLGEVSKSVKVEHYAKASPLTNLQCAIEAVCQIDKDMHAAKMITTDQSNTI